MQQWEVDNFKLILVILYFLAFSGKWNSVNLKNHTDTMQKIKIGSSSVGIG